MEEDPDEGQSQKGEKLFLHMFVFLGRFPSINLTRRRVVSVPAVHLQRRLHKCWPFIPLRVGEQLFVVIPLSFECQHSTEECTSLRAVWAVGGV